MPIELIYALVFVLLIGLAGLFLQRRWQSRRALVRRLEELSTLAEMGRSIVGAQLDLHLLAQLVYAQAGKIVDTNLFQLGLFEADRYRLLIWIMDGQPRPTSEFRLTADALGIVGWVRESRQSLIVRDFEDEHESLPARPRYISTDPPRSAVFVPLAVGQTVLGAIAIQSRRPGAFNEEHLRLLSIVANHAAAALENARLYEQARRQTEHLQALAGISQQLNAVQALPSLYRQVTRLAAENFPGYAISYFEAVPAGLTLRASTRAVWQNAAVNLPLGQGLVGGAAAERRAISAEPEAPELALPVEIDDRLLGVLHVEGPPAGLEAGTTEIFKSLAAQLAVSILEGQTYAAEQRRAEQLSAIALASRAAASTLQLEDLLDEVLDLADEHFGFRPAHIFLLQDERLVFTAGIGRLAERWAVAGHSLGLQDPGLAPQAARTRQPAVAADLGPADLRSAMVVPLVMGSHLLGVFEVLSEQPNAFNPDDVQTLRTVADTLAVAVRNARLFESERRRRRLAEILRETSGALTSTLNLDSVLDLILDGLRRVVSYDAASILLVNDLGEVQLRAARGILDVEDVLDLPLAVRLLSGEAERLPAVVTPFSEVDTLGEYHDLLALPDPHACLGAVLSLRAEHLGYLVVDLAGQEAFPPEDVEVITAFASQAAVAIENARLYAAQREQAWISTALLQVAESTARTTELRQVFETVAQLTPMLVGVDRCAVLQLEDGQMILQAYTATDQPEAPRPASFQLDPAAWPRLAEMLASRAPVVVEQDDEMPAICRPLVSGVVILLPLLAKGEVQGVLWVGQGRGDRPFTAHRIRLLGGIANQAALALESAMLHRAQEEEAWVSTALLQVAQAVAGQPTLDEALITVARLTPMLVGLERVAIFQWDRAAQRFSVAQLMSPLPPPAAALSLSAADLCLDLLDPAALAMLVDLPPALEAVFGVTQGLVWPLWARGDLLGALVVEYGGKALGRRLNILNGIANQLSVMLESARLAREVTEQERMERELEVGRDIQASFLPKDSPQAPGWELDTYWRVARQVGGDFYDFIPLRSLAGGERWGIVIADVADKGVPAALFMALSRTLLRSVAIGRVSPAATLHRVNQLILADARSELFVTVFYGVWEPRTGQFHYTSGGHNPPLVFRQNGEIQRLTTRGVALGVMEEAEYEEREITLEPGETLLLYTDGVTDAINNQEEEFGLHRLLQVASAASAGSAVDLVREVVAAVDRHADGADAFDDLTLVALKRLA